MHSVQLTFPEIQSNDVNQKFIITFWEQFSRHIVGNELTLSRWRPLSYRNQSIDLLGKSMDWFLYENGLRPERIKIPKFFIFSSYENKKVVHERVDTQK